MAEKLRAAVGGLSERLDGRIEGQISFGCGIASYPQDGVTAHTLIAAADTQLYEDKQAQHLQRAKQGEETVSAREPSAQRAHESSGGTALSVETA